MKKLCYITALALAVLSAQAQSKTNSNAGLIGWAAVAGSGATTTTGGGDVTPQRVTTLEELRTLAGDGTPRVLLLIGTIEAGASPVEIASNKTLRGVDKNAKIQGGLNIRSGCSNIIVQNLSVQGNGKGKSPADVIAARGSHHLWFDHLTLWEGGDGILDLTRGCNFITVSWCKFYYTDSSHGHRLANLIGGGSTHGATDTGKNNVTLHHNWFAELVSSRMPRLLFGKGHIFNNYYTSTGNGYCIGSGSWSSLTVENNYFKNVKSPHQFQDTNPSFISASGNIYDNTTGNKHTGPGGSGVNPPGPWTPSADYPYTMDEATNVPTLVMRGAGPQ